MKAVLMSIRPEWCKKILSGEKTVEVRKTRPKLETPFKVYIYCAMTGSDKFFTESLGRNVDEWNLWKYPKRLGRVIGEFTCCHILHFDSEFYEHASSLGGTELYSIPLSERGALEICHEKGCLSDEDLLYYFGDEGWEAYFWHISDLKIYDKSEPLSDFSKYGFSGLFGTNICGNEDCEYYEPSGDRMVPPTCGLNGYCSLHRPPQSWCYVEELKDA